MTKTMTTRLTVDWLMVMALAALAYSLTVFLHEGTHALTCPIVGQQVLALNALFVDCGEGAGAPAKIVAGAAPIINLILGFLVLSLLRRSLGKASEWRWFLWLFMLMNFLTGAGYFMFSGIANIGDLAVVIDGWQPAWAWRVGMALVGSVGYLALVWLTLRELGRIIGGEEPELYKRAIKLGILSYLAAIGIVLLVGAFNPYGWASLPVTAGLAAALGGMSPLVWMMFWFQAKLFTKTGGQTLVIERNWTIIGAAFVFVLFYAVVLGQTVYFGR